MNADELDAAREAVSASRRWRDQMRADWGQFREPEEVLDEAVGELTAERDRLHERVLEMEDQVGERERHLRDALKDMRAERDRLRSICDAVGAQSIVDVVTERDQLKAVVDVLREYLPLTERPAIEVDEQERLALWLAMRKQLRLLDGEGA